MKILLSVCILFALIGAIFFFLRNKRSDIDSRGVGGAYRYDEKILYVKGEPLQFEDFQITYIGEVPPPAPIDVGVGYQFEVVSKKGQKQHVTVLNSGSVIPAGFDINDKEHFVLNLLPVEFVSSLSFYMVISKESETVLKEYRAPDNSFSFKYPEFPGWEFYHLSEDGYTIFLHDPKLGKVSKSEAELPQIIIGTADPVIASAPQQGFKKYYKESSSVSITAPTGWLLIITLPNRDEQGFSQERMAQVIMDTIKFGK